MTNLLTVKYMLFTKKKFFSSLKKGVSDSMLFISRNVLSFYHCMRGVRKGLAPGSISGNSSSYPTWKNWLPIWRMTGIRPTNEKQI